MQNKKIIITGSAGFIGSHLVDVCIESGFDVTAFDHYNPDNNWGWLESTSCKDEIEIISGDIRDPFFCKKISSDVDAIMHLAALIAIPYSYEAPSSYVDTNIQGTLNICQAALENNVKKVRADWTFKNESILVYLNKYNKFGVPFNILYSKKFPEGYIFNELLTINQVKKVLNKTTSQ